MSVRNNAIQTNSRRLLWSQFEIIMPNPVRTRSTYFLDKNLTAHSHITTSTTGEFMHYVTLPHAINAESPKGRGAARTMGDVPLYPCPLYGMPTHWEESQYPGGPGGPRTPATPLRPGAPREPWEPDGPGGPGLDSPDGPTEKGGEKVSLNLQPCDFCEGKLKGIECLKIKVLN